MKFRKVVFVLVALALVCLLVASVAPSPGTQVIAEPESVLSHFDVTRSAIILGRIWVCNIWKCWW